MTNSGGIMPEMGEPVSEVHIERESNTGKWILLALAIIYVAGSLYLTLSVRAHLDRLSRDYAGSKVEIAELTRRVQSAEANDETLAHQVGITKKEMRRAPPQYSAASAKHESPTAERTHQVAEVAGVKICRGVRPMAATDLSWGTPPPSWNARLATWVRDRLIARQGYLECASSRRSSTLSPLPKGQAAPVSTVPSLKRQIKKKASTPQRHSHRTIEKKIAR